MPVAPVREQMVCQVQVGPAEPIPQPQPDPLSEAVAALEPDRMTPREALETLYRLRTLLQATGLQATDQQVSGKDACR